MTLTDPRYPSPELLPGEEDDYADLLHKFHANKNFPSQPQEVSDRAAKLAIDAVAQYHVDSSSCNLLADELMDSFDSDSSPESPSKAKIGIMALARMDPDLDTVTECIYEIHKRRRINYEPTPEEAGSAIFTVAIRALRTIQSHAKAVYGQKAPELADTISRISNFGLATGPWLINYDAVRDLQNFLSDHPEVRCVVAKRIKAAADSLRAQTGQLPMHH